MKLISGLVRPSKVDAVRQGLGGIHICALTVIESKDYSPQAHEDTVWMGHRYRGCASPKMDIRFVVHDEDVDEAVDLIMRLAWTGQPGDGCVCVTPVEHRYDICTGRRDVS